MFLQATTISLLICFNLGGHLKTNGLAAQAEKCGGILHSDDGEIEIQPSKSNCLWVIKLKSMTGISLELKEFTTEPITVIPAQKNSQATLQSTWMVGPEATYAFEGKIFVILATPRDQKMSLSWTGLTADFSVVTLNAKFESSLEGTLEWERKLVGVDTTIWAVEPEGSGKFDWEMSSDLSHCGQDSPCQCISFGVIHVMPDGRINNIHKSCEGSSVGSWKVERSSLVVLIFVDSTLGEGSKLQVKWKCEQERRTRKVAGIAVGTEEGLYFIDLNPRKMIQVSSKRANGVAFDWSSEKIYWTEKGVGIMRANVDGSNFEQLITDQHANGLRIEPVTGNLYYGSNSRRSLRVCNNDGKKCSSIISLFGTLYDIALHPSKGLLYWSIIHTEVLRANLDGSNVTQIVRESSYGMDVDEQEDRLYTLCHTNYEIITYDLNGQDLRTVQEVDIDTIDVKVDGDILYYSSGWASKSLHSIAKGDTSPTLIADFPDHTRYIALFGERIRPTWSNPCENTKCFHLCVLNGGSSYRCLCPDGKKLLEDGSSCSY